MKKFALICVLLFIMTMSGQLASAQLEQNLPIIISFSSDVSSLPLEKVEAGTEKITLSWETLNMKEDYTLQLYAYEIATWVSLLTPESPPLEANGSFVVTVRHPLNFNPPIYRLLITDANLQVYSEAVVTIPYTATASTLAPSITSFTAEPLSVDANQLAYGTPSISVSWAVADRSPTSNLAFEQVLPDGSAVSVELSRRNLWVSSSGGGVIAAVYPTGGKTVALRLKLVDLLTGTVLDEAGQQITITGTLSTPTPVPARPTQDPNQPTAPPADVAANVPAPVTGAGAGGGFELGGHLASFGGADVARSAGMTWVKKQVRWHQGEGTGAAGGLIDGAHGSGFKIMLSIVGYTSEMGDFETYTNDFAAYLGQVAALGPDAIEVWNEPNIDREWPAGTVSGATYTVMLSKAFNAIKSTNGGVMVISAAPAPTGFFGGGCANAGCDDNVFLRQMANAGAASYLDCVGAHYNEGIISPDQTSGDPRGGHYSRYFSAMLNLYYNTFGGSRPVCWTELGFLTPEGYGPLPGNFAWAQNTTIAQQSEWLGRATQISRQSGRVRIMIVWNVDFTIYDNDPQAGYAIIRADGTCPACASLAAAMQ